MHSAPEEHRSRLRASAELARTPGIKLKSLDEHPPGRLAEIRGCWPLLTMISRDPGKHHYFMLYLQTDRTRERGSPLTNFLWNSCAWPRSFAIGLFTAS